MKHLYAVLAVVLALSGTAWAHSDEELDKRVGAHGGQLRMAGQYHFELVLGENKVSLYLTDHADQPKPAEGLSGQVLLLASQAKTNIELKPVKDNLLEGTGTFAIVPEMKVMVMLNVPGQPPLQAKFRPGQPAAPAPATPPAPEHTHSESEPAHKH